MSLNILSTLTLMLSIWSFICCMAASDCSTFLFPSPSVRVVSSIAEASESMLSLNSATYFTISSADCEVFEDKILTCSATTEKPFPASPALAASIEAFKARRLLWLATFWTMSTISSILLIFPLKSWTF